MTRENKIDWFMKPVVESKNPMWRRYANCKNVPKNVFVIGKGQTPKQALSFCSTCVVQSACLEYALDNNCVGIWGNTTQKQRTEIKRKQRVKENK